MPFYEYECQSCKFYTEVMQKISEPPLVKCPSCGKRTLKKLMSAPVFRLKGSGWYETDFKSDKEGKRNLADREEPRPEESKTEKSEKAEKSDKSDAKSATPEAAPKPSESKAASVTTGGKAVAGSAARKRPAAAKGGARTGSARPKAKASSRARPAKRGSRR